MGSVGNSNPWEPFDSYRDCSLGICSRFCPQFCSLIFSPPPTDDDPGTPFSPLIIAVIGVLASTFILVSYYTIVTRYCRGRNNDHSGTRDHDQNRDEIARDQWQAPAGLDDALIKNIAVCRYQKGDGLIEGTECAVCLSEFQEMESLRLLPKCSHAFHLPCIDIWLKSQSNCPLCRANVVSPAPPPPMPLSPPPRPALNVNSYETGPPPAGHLILVVADCQETDHVSSKSPIQENRDSDETGIDQENGKPMRRSISFNTFPACGRSPLNISNDVVRIEEGEEDSREKMNECWRDIGSSKVAIKRSVSDGGLIHYVFTPKQRQEFFYSTSSHDLI